MYSAAVQYAMMMQPLRCGDRGGREGAARRCATLGTARVVFNAADLSNRFRCCPLPATPCRYSALFVDEDPDVDLGEGGRGSACGRKEPGVSVMGSGHVRLRQKEAAQGRDRRAKGDGGRELWASGSSEDEGGPPAGGSRQSTPRKVCTPLRFCGGGWLGVLDLRFRRCFCSKAEARCHGVGLKVMYSGVRENKPWCARRLPG